MQWGYSIPPVADPGFVNGGPGNRRETRGGSREGCTPPWVRGPGRSPGSCRFCRSPHMSFKEYSESKQGFQCYYILEIMPNFEFV